LLLESYTIKTKLHDHINFHEIISIHFRTWNSIFTYWEHILKLCIDYIKQFMKPYQSEKDWYGFMNSKVNITFYCSMWCYPLNSNMCWCQLGGHKHSISTFDDWKVMIFEKALTWNCQVGDHTIDFAKISLYHWKKQNCHLHSIVKLIIFYNLTFSFFKNSCLSNDDKGFKHDIKSILNDIPWLFKKGLVIKTILS